MKEERLEAQEKEEVGVSPLGIPMLAGPGALSTVMVLMGQSAHWWQAIPIYAAIAITAVVSYFTLAGANRVRGYLGETGIRVLGRLMGLVLMAIAVQFVLNGLADVQIRGAGGLGGGARHGSGLSSKALVAHALSVPRRQSCRRPAQATRFVLHRRGRRCRTRGRVRYNRLAASTSMSRTRYAGVQGRVSGTEYHRGSAILRPLMVFLWRT